MSTIEAGKILVTRNSAHGVKVSHEFYNSSEKEIKYITFSYVPYNSVNDPVTCTASGKSEASGKLTGPISPKYKGYIKWENMWYNPTVTYAILTRVIVQYMDNSEEVIEGKDIVSMHDENGAYYNEVYLPAQKREEERKKIEATANRLSASEDGMLKVFEEYKNDEKTLLRILDCVSVGVHKGYLIGDHIEKEYSSNEEFMKHAVRIWKESIKECQRWYAIGDAAKKRIGIDLMDKYIEKIQKYDPTYVAPPKITFLSALLGGATLTF